MTLDCYQKQPAGEPYCCAETTPPDRQYAFRLPVRAGATAVAPRHGRHRGNLMTGAWNANTNVAQVLGSDDRVEGLSKLAVVERVVQAAALQQIRMVAVLHDAPVVHDDDRVGVSVRGQPVGDDKLVRPCRRRAMASWMRTSVRVSTLLVASSRMRIGGLARNARAIVSSCFCPEEKLEASASSRVSYPSGKVRTK
jgi:hypothetical protein